jgi:hypothetical protein
MIRYLSIFCTANPRRCKKLHQSKTPSVLDLAPWQLEVAVEISRLVKTEAKQERYTAPLIEEIPLPVDVVSRAVESEVYLQR